MSRVFTWFVQGHLAGEKWGQDAPGAQASKILVTLFIPSSHLYKGNDEAAIKIKSCIKPISILIPVICEFHLPIAEKRKYVKNYVYLNKH